MSFLTAVSNSSVSASECAARTRLRQAAKTTAPTATWIHVRRSVGRSRPPAASTSTQTPASDGQHEPVELQVDGERDRELDLVEGDQPDDDHERGDEPRQGAAGARPVARPRRERGRARERHAARRQPARGQRYGRPESVRRAEHVARGVHDRRRPPAPAGGGGARLPGAAGARRRSSRATPSATRHAPAKARRKVSPKISLVVPPLSIEPSRTPELLELHLLRRVPALLARQVGEEVLHAGDRAVGELLGLGDRRRLRVERELGAVGVGAGPRAGRACASRRAAPRGARRRARASPSAR